MSASAPIYTQRPPTAADASRVLALQIASDLAAYGDIDSSLDDLRYEWSLMDLNRDATLIFAGDMLVGYGAYSATGRAPHADFCVHPAQREDGVRRLLLTAIIARAQQAAEESGAMGPAWLRTIVPSVNGKDREAVARAGFTVLKQYYRMQIELLDPPEPIVTQAGATADGIIIRALQHEQEIRAIYDVVNAAFTRIGRPEPAFAQWRITMLRGDQFDPALWFLAQADGKLAGVALCYDYDAYAWVRQLAVAPGFQGRRIGSSLLRHAFYELHARDFLTVALGVDSENPHGCGFYERLGMEQVRQYDEYGLRLR